MAGVVARVSSLGILDAAQDLVQALLGCLQRRAFLCERASFELRFAHDAAWFSRCNVSHAFGGSGDKLRIA